MKKYLRQIAVFQIIVFILFQCPFAWAESDTYYKHRVLLEKGIDIIEDYFADQASEIYYQTIIDNFFANQKSMDDLLAKIENEAKAQNKSLSQDEVNKAVVDAIIREIFQPLADNLAKLIQDFSCNEVTAQILERIQNRELLNGVPIGKTIAVTLGTGLVTALTTIGVGYLTYTSMSTVAFISAYVAAYFAGTTVLATVISQTVFGPAGWAAAGVTVITGGGYAYYKYREAKDARAKAIEELKVQIGKSESKVKTLWSNLVSSEK